MTPEDMAAIHARAGVNPWSAASFAAMRAQTGSLLIHAPHAFALGRVIADEAELLQIATDPAHQRQGLGTRMLAGFEAEAKARGGLRAVLEVAQGNTAAHRLYTSCGWTEDGIRPNYYRLAGGAREDARLMSKNL